MPQKPGSEGSDTSKTPMTSTDASRIQSAADRNPSSKTNTEGFKERAQAAAAHNQNSQVGEFDYTAAKSINECRN
ncbi:hypothetical protein BGZ80_006198 [Entomortierella chlamydospora]|uniref:SMP domain-containing protein n=1 Tax=Entomortierella chlamydospora TaxID=101097 RepID=A0A9P6SU02_9FUNG|nr:hypothetical protein BGZ80_006198 [Entomortierella chlamydospora]